MHFRNLLWGLDRLISLCQNVSIVSLIVCCVRGRLPLPLGHSITVVGILRVIYLDTNVHVTGWSFASRVTSLLLPFVCIRASHICTTPKNNNSNNNEKRNTRPSREASIRYQEIELSATTIIEQTVTGRAVPSPTLQGSHAHGDGSCATWLARAWKIVIISLELTTKSASGTDSLGVGREATRIARDDASTAAVRTH